MTVESSKERGGIWAVYYISPQSFIIRWLNNFGGFYWILIGWFIKFINLSAIVLSL